MLAYLDAGSGSMIAQAVVAGLAGVAVVARVGWRRMMSLFRRRRLESERPVGHEQSDASC
ncbi:MAG TPA: hypothetical protein VM618_07835 [Acidimicrobiia bacterium]|nr:hypothetical protein [Acidimicrobiia bacterium]